MKVILIADWSGKKAGEEVNVSEYVVEYLKHDGLIDSATEIKPIIVDQQTIEQIEKKTISKAKQKKNIPMPKNPVIE